MARHRSSPAFVLVLACAVALGGCGTVTHVTRTVTRTASGSGTASSSTPAGGSATSGASPLPGRSPRQIVDLAARALSRADGYAMRADLTQRGRRTVIAMTTTGLRTFNASIDTGRQETSVVRIGTATYLRGDRAFWLGQAGSSAAARARAAQLAGYWLKVPAASRASVDGSLGTLAPQTLARCLREDHGRLTVAGHTTIAGRSAVVIRDAGNAPGATPATIAIAAGGTPYPLRYVARGTARRGGPVDVCNTGKGGGATGTISFSQFGEIAPIQAPTGASSDPDAPVT